MSKNIFSVQKQIGQEHIGIGKDGQQIQMQVRQLSLPVELGLSHKSEQGPVFFRSLTVLYNNPPNNPLLLRTSEHNP